MQKSLDEDENTNSVSIFTMEVLEKSIKNRKTITQGKSMDSQMEQIGHRLVTTILIISPQKLTPTLFHRSLRNYRLSIEPLTTESTMSSNAEMLRVVNIQSLFTGFQESERHHFYVIFPKSQGILCFYHQQELKRMASYALINPSSSINTQILQKEGIEHRRSVNIRGDELIKIQGNHISLLLGFLFNKLLETSIQTQILSNYSFCGSNEIMPLVTYKGVEQRPEYKYLATVQTNYLGVDKKSAQAMKLVGLWDSENMHKLNQDVNKMTEGKYTVELEFLPGTQKLQEMKPYQKNKGQ